MATRIAVLGDVNQDFIMRSEAMPRPGETCLARELRFAAGGKGGNQAVAAARAGAQVQLISAVGDDPFGAQLLAGLEREGVGTEFVLRGQQVASGMAFIVLSPTGQNSILHAPGAAELVTPDWVDKAAPAIVEAQWLLVTLGVPVPSALRALQIAREAGTRVLLDPAPVCPDLDPLWPLTTISTPNETETEAIMGVRPGSVQQAAEAAQWFRARGVEIAVIKLGAHGSVVLDAAGARLIRPYRVQVVDTTACGDAFAGALATRLAEGASVDEALCFANAAGALAATVLGAQPSLPGRGTIEALMAAQRTADRIVAL